MKEFQVRVHINLAFIYNNQKNEDLRNTPHLKELGQAFVYLVIYIPQDNLFTMIA